MEVSPLTVTAVTATAYLPGAVTWVWGPKPDRVLTVRVALCRPVSLKSTTEGLSAQEACDGAPEQER
jgi:hypothetical protein